MISRCFWMNCSAAVPTAITTSGGLLGVLLPHEGGCARFVPGVGDAHEIEKLSVDHELLLAALTKPLLDAVDRLSGGGKRIIEPAQNEHTTRRLLCVGLS